jgi:GT2 family glycosyltransferase
MDFVGDDYVAVSTAPPAVHHVYATAKLHPAVRIGPFERTFNTDDEKAVLYIPASTVQSRIRLTGIATLRITGQPMSHVETTTADALRAAALYTTLEQIAHPTGLEAVIDDLIEKLPGGQLAIGNDVDDLLRALSDVVEQPTALQLMPASDQHPTLSVIIPVHNGAEFLADAVKSVRQQDLDIEVVVVDDGSVDDLAPIIATLPIDVVLRQPNRGPAAARNAGVAASSGEIITFLDVDDVWPMGRMRALLHEIIHGRAQVAIGLAQLVRRTDTGQWEKYGVPEASFPWSAGAAMSRREVFREVGGFDEDMRFAEDTDWFHRLKESGIHIRRIPVTTLIVRRHGANMTEGRDPVELHVVRAVKKALDRNRSRARYSPMRTGDDRA